MDHTKDYVARLQAVLDNVPCEQVPCVVDILIEAYQCERCVFVMGNGGSAATASHFACDLAKGTINKSGKRFRVIPLADSIPILTAWANDVAYEDIFAEQVSNFVGKGDVVIGFSGSGNSPNVLKALEIARARGALTVGLTGYRGGRMKDIVDHCIIVPSNSMQHIEDAHMVLAHSIFLGICRKVHPESPYLTALDHGGGIAGKGY